MNFYITVWEPVDTSPTQSESGAKTSTTTVIPSTTTNTAKEGTNDKGYTYMEYDLLCEYILYNMFGFVRLGIIKCSP